MAGADPHLRGLIDLPLVSARTGSGGSQAASDQSNTRQFGHPSIKQHGQLAGRADPKPILAQLGLAGTVDLQVRDGVIEIRPSRANPREGWAEDARRIAASDPDPLVWPAFANQDDADLAW